MFLALTFFALIFVAFLHIAQDMLRCDAAYNATDKAPCFNDDLGVWDLGFFTQSEVPGPGYHGYTQDKYGSWRSRGRFVSERQVIDDCLNWKDAICNYATDECADDNVVFIEDGILNVVERYIEKRYIDAAQGPTLAKTLQAMNPMQRVTWLDDIQWILFGYDLKRLQREQAQTVRRNSFDTIEPTITA